MPTVSLSAEQDAVGVQSPAYGAGAGPHLPIGYWSGWKFRAGVRFPVPAGWAAWTSITKATLNVYISDHAHVGVRNSSIYVRRQYLSTPYWTKAEGTQDCNSGFSSGNNTQYDDLAPTTTGQVSFASGTTPNAKKSITVTGLVQYYKDAAAAKIVFIFDPADTDDYTELWSTEKTGGYDLTLDIEYVAEAPPSAPTLGTPVDLAITNDTTPTFTWTHVDPNGDPQTAAEVEIYDSAGTTLLYTLPVTGTAETVDATTPLTRGATYKWRARTQDVTGWGAYSAMRTFTIRAAPTLNISATRKMVFANGGPRLVVEWTMDQPQASYRVTAPGYDSGVISSGVLTHTLTTKDLVDNTPVTVTVDTVDTYGLTATDSQAFTPRYGLTTHRKDLASAPVNWETPTIDSTVPAGASLAIEYGSSATATAAPSPNVWYSSLSAVPLARYVFYRAWFIPSASAGPTLNAITIPANFTVALVDKWGTTKDTAGLVAPWAVDTGEYVYGSRSIRADVSGAGPFPVYSYGVKVRAGRSYILTGLMKSQGNSGAHFRLEDAAGVLTGGGILVPTGPVTSEALAATKDWFTSDRRDVNRYRTPVYVADADKTVWVALRVGGTSGAKAWFDAIKLEESTVATPWSPGAVGAVVADAGGLQVDATKGGVFRLRAADGAIVDLGASGLERNDQLLLPAPYVSTSAPASPPDGQLWWDTDDASVGLGSATGAGTSFPGSPAVNDVFFRTDKAMMFVWNGTRWLCTCPHQAQQGPWQVALAYPVAASTGSGAIYMPIPDRGMDIWWESATAFFFVVAGTALSASHKWVGTSRITPAITTIHTLNIDSGAVSTYRWVTDSAGGVLDMTGSQVGLEWAWTKTGTPGNLRADLVMSYRYIGV